jgi:hypothetical protein
MDYILVLLGHELFQLVDHVFELVFFHDVVFNATRENEDFEVILALEALRYDLNELVALIVDGSLLFEFKNGLVIHNPIVST